MPQHRRTFPLDIAEVIAQPVAAAFFLIADRAVAVGRHYANEIFL